MNEAELMIYLLTRKNGNSIIGATEKELLNGLVLTDRNARYKLIQLLQELNTNLAILGLNVKYNSANGRWFIAFRDNVADIIEKKTFAMLSSTLAATLFTILLLSISTGGPVQKSEILEMRNRKRIDDHLRELRDLGYIIVKKSTVSLTPKIFYYINTDDIIKEIQNIDQNQAVKKLEPQKKSANKNDKISGKRKE
ncbi:MAG: hypothetical protein GF364_16630 [Candidatus Lokiarchaeota archaeon]|nr:hypothetical protein [Candidatus Lokiarchaeota archaeon]